MKKCWFLPLLFICNLCLSGCANRNIVVLEESHDLHGMTKQRVGYIKDGKPVLHGIQWDRKIPGSSGYTGMYEGIVYKDGILNPYASYLKSGVRDPILSPLPIKTEQSSER